MKEEYLRQLKNSKILCDRVNYFTPTDFFSNDHNPFLKEPRGRDDYIAGISRLFTALEHILREYAQFNSLVVCEERGILRDSDEYRMREELYDLIISTKKELAIWLKDFIKEYPTEKFIRKLNENKFYSDFESWIEV